jgi:hypothetical protein
MAPTCGGIHKYNEEDPVEDTLGPKEARLNVPCIDVFNGESIDPNQSHLVNLSDQYVKNPGEFADAAPGEQPSIEDSSEGPSPDTSSIGPEDVDPRKEQTKGVGKDRARTVVVAERTDSVRRPVSTERNEEGSRRPVVVAVKPGTVKERISLYNKKSMDFSNRELPKT